MSEREAHPSARLAPEQPGPHDSNAILSNVDPELRDTARQILEAPAPPPLGPQTLPVMRTLPPPFDMPAIKVAVERRTIPGPPGAPDVAIHIINPQPPGRRRPVILHMHGGGFVLGTAESSVFGLQDLCLALDCPAVSVEYRLAPETTFNGSVEDNYAGLQWLNRHADEIGVDPSRIALMGESAGGGHAALLAIAARDRGEVPVAFQCLLCPMLDDRTGSSRPVPPHIGRIFWTAEANRFGWMSFLGTEPGLRSAPRGGVPARVANLRGLPPTFIATGSIDLFVDEDIEYARRLIDADVPCGLLVVPGAFHGFDAFAPESGPARKFREAILSALRRGLSA